MPRASGGGLMMEDFKAPVIAFINKFYALIIINYVKYALISSK